MSDWSLLQRVAIMALPILFGITVHEVAHGWVASRLGDPTAKMLGRLTLNPLKHIHPVGTVLVPALTMLAGGFLFGWAKPVPVNIARLHRPRRDMVLVARAGPGANLVMGLAWALAARVGLHYHETLGSLAQPLILMGIAGVFFNSILLVLNLIPLPPLDGSRVVSGLLPRRLAMRYARIERWGLAILLLLLVSGGLSAIMWPVLEPVLHLFSGIAGIPWHAFERLLMSLLSSA